MKAKNFRATYDINGKKDHIDFSVGTIINDETINISASHVIFKKHPNIKKEEISNIKIEELNIW